MTFYDFAKAIVHPLTGALFAVTATGYENVPASGPLIVASNHRSYLDPALIGSWFPRVVRWMAKEELFRIPILSTLIRWCLAFPVARGEGDVGSIRRALRILKEGGVVGIFPEGTRNVSGEHAAKSGAVLLATLAQCPIVPIGVLRTDVAWRKLRASHVTMRIGAPLKFQGRTRRATKPELDAWTDELSKRIEELTD